MGRIAAGVLAAALLAARPFGAAASPAGETRAGNELYHEGKFTEARDRYLSAQADRPQAPELDLNIGSTFHNEGRQEEALRAFGKLASRPKTPRRLLAAAAYGTGNALYRLGRFDEAIEAYKAALRIDPGDADAKYNLELSRRKREQEKQEQEEKEGGEGNDDKEKKEQKENEKKGDKKDDQQSKGEEKSDDPNDSEGKKDPGEDQKSPPDSSGEGKNQEQPDQKPGADSSGSGAGSAGERPPAGADSARAGASGEGRMSQEDALRILQALEAQEMAQARERDEKALRARLAREGKDW